ncbi:MAG: hypothetical protein ACT4OZ_07725 [Gemmatimonadota bacterium]
MPNKQLWVRFRWAACCIAALDGCTGEVPERAAPAVAWSFEAPSSWGDRVEMEESSSPGTARSTRTFAYRSPDGSGDRQILLAIALYDSATWAAESASGGDTLATAPGVVFVARITEANPFRSGVREARVFDSLMVTLDDVRRGFRVLRELP